MEKTPMAVQFRANLFNLRRVRRFFPEGIFFLKKSTTSLFILPGIRQNVDVSVEKFPIEIVFFWPSPCILERVRAISTAGIT